MKVAAAMEVDPISLSFSWREMDEIPE